MKDANDQRRNQKRGIPSERKTILLSSAFAFLGVIIGGIITASSSYVIQNQQYVLERQGKFMEKREQVYHDYLNVADKYSVDTHIFLDCIKGGTEGRAKLSGKDGEGCKTGDLISSRHDYMEQLNELRIYGSSDAIDLARQMTFELPAPSGAHDNTLHGVPKKILDVDFKYNDGKFNNAYTRFISLMCRELSYDPDMSCSG